ncbi:nucleoside recognition domain-containing protein [Polycladomyces abyssicola]|uniref:nucleoside recognition domain-containing protein n=1 Tax=Polycladomyces abyssicola TaxID=1125966 RepID=UPI001BB2DA86|nr:nucleoside recognition domain-containing protein [Polycladomyces abyssicola]
MMNMSPISWKKGLKTGIHTSWTLGKVIFTVTLLVNILQYTTVIKNLSQALTPTMKWIGLPGEATIPLILGNLINLYAGIGAILSISLTKKEVFILAVMLSFSHNLVLESVICKKIGVNPLLISFFRIFTAILFGWIVQICWNGGNSQAQYGLINTNPAIPNGWTEIFTQGLKTATFNTLQFCLIAIPLLIMIQALHDMNLIHRFTRWTSFFVESIGIEKRANLTITSGLLFGLMFGAGMMIQQVKERVFKKRDLTIMMILLSLCHAVVEDTIAFIPLNTYLVTMIIIRFGGAMIISLIVARILLPKPQIQKEKRVG